MTMKRKTGHNSTYTQVGVQCFYESEVLNPSSVLLMKFSAKNPHLRVAAKRYLQAEKKANARSCTFGFCQHTKPTLKNQKSLPFPTAPEQNIHILYTVF